MLDSVVIDTPPSLATDRMLTRGGPVRLLYRFGENYVKRREPSRHLSTPYGSKIIVRA